MSFDLSAAIAEANAKKAPVAPFEFDFAGEKYTLPARVDLRAAALLRRDALRGLELLLGAEQWKRMLAGNEVFDEDGLMILIENYAAHTGSTLGESSASSTSSKRTVKPSRRTSSGTTKLR